MTYEDFVEALNKSRPAVFRVAEWLHRKGFNILIPSIKVFPKGEDPAKYVDSCDLYANGEKIEVKHLGIKFTCHDDFPYKKFVVSNKNTVERNWGFVKAYVLVNEDMTHAAVINSDTKEKWWKETVRPKNRNYDETYYFCSIYDGKFWKL